MFSVMLRSVLLCVFVLPSLWGQNLEVIAFEKTDVIDARVYKKRDRNGEICALIKINTPLKDLRFDSSLGIIDISRKNGEYWVYVSPTERRLEIWTDGYIKLKYKIPAAIKAQETYDMVLRADVQKQVITTALAPGFLTIESQPSGASVYIDGQHIGQTPFQKSLKSGKHSLTLKHPGYKDLQQDAVQITDEQTTRLKLALERIPPGILDLSIKPADAAVFIDKKQMGKGSMRYELIAGLYFIEVKKAGYYPKSWRIDIFKGRTKKLTIELIPKKGQLQITTQPFGAAIYIDGKKVGETPLSKTWNAGSYQVELRKDGYRSHTSTVEVILDKQTKIAHTFKKRAVNLSTAAFSRAWWNGLDNNWKKVFNRKLGRGTATTAPSDVQLEELSNLKWLHCSDNKITDLSPLVGLVNLERLYVWGNKITDLSPLASLVNLKVLWCNGNKITDLSPLAGLVNLKVLWCNGNKITDLSPLAGLMKLQILSFNRNKVADLSPLAGLVNLQKLLLNRNKVADLSPLAALVKLKKLRCSDNEISTTQITAFKRQHPNCEVTH